MAYKIVKITGRSGWFIDDGSGSSIRYSTKANAERQIARWIESDAAAKVYEAERRTARLIAARDYLALRAARAAENAKQLTLAF